MAKKNREKGESGLKLGKADSQALLPFLAQKEAVDPSLAKLFASSAGPVLPPTKIASTCVGVENSPDAEAGSLDQDDEELSSLDRDLEDTGTASAEEEIESFHSSHGLAALSNQPAAHKPVQNQLRKRKRQYNGDSLEGNYMLRIAKEEEEKDEKVRQGAHQLKRQKLIVDQEPNMSRKEEHLDDALGNRESDESELDAINGDPSNVPLHETLTQDKDTIELEKSSRTTFLANVSTSAISDKKAKKTLLNHIESFLESLPIQDGERKHKIESIRFRSTAYAGGGLPKKVAFATKNLMEATTKSTNAYIVYSTAFAAREAVKRLNGTMVLDRHLRVDSVAHPAKIDHRRCVFVGNLGFVDDESIVDQGGENERKRLKIPSDVEEGLWRQFSKAGTVESVRVVRDEKTRVGKGFAYVQFHDANSVEAALLFHGKKYPPMLPRILRVTRAKAVKKTALASQNTRLRYKPTLNGLGDPDCERIYNPKVSGQHQSIQGRAAKLLGKAGAARFMRVGRGGGHEAQPRKRLEGITRAPGNIVFEGYRARRNTGKPKDLKLGGSGGKKKGKPRTRSSKRASDWKKGRGKKAK